MDVNIYTPVNIFRAAVEGYDDYDTTPLAS